MTKKTARRGCDSEQATLGDKRGESHAILRGELMAILDLAAGRQRSPKTEVITNALACPRNEMKHLLSSLKRKRPSSFAYGCNAQPEASAHLLSFLTVCFFAASRADSNQEKLSFIC